MPVMEGKAMLFKEFAGIDAWPIALKRPNQRCNGPSNTLSRSLR